MATGVYNGFKGDLRDKSGQFVELEAEMFYQYGYKLEFYNGNDIMVLRKD